MKVSVIIPTYNVEPYIVDCLQSVASQTYQGQMECIIVDDCGTDNSIKVAKDFIAQYNGPIAFKVLHREKNGGLSAARNSGTNIAQGDYIYYLDSDDMITPDCIEQFMDIAAKYPDADVIQGGVAILGGGVVSDIEKRVLPEISYDRKWIKERYMLNKGFPVAAYSRMYKRSFLNDNNLRFHEGIIHEDVPFAFVMAQKIKSLAFCMHNSYLYRTQRPGSIVSSANKRYAFESRMKVLEDCINSFDDLALDVQIKGVLHKTLCYLAITDKQIFDKTLFSPICMKIVEKVSFPSSFFLRFYFALPLAVQRNRIARNIVALLYDIKN